MSNKWLVDMENTETKRGKGVMSDYSKESECFKLGNNGQCNLDCPKYHEGECPQPEEMITESEGPEDMEIYNTLYEE